MGFQPYENAPPVPDRRRPLRKIGNFNFFRLCSKIHEIFILDNPTGESQNTEGATAAPLEPHYENGLTFDSSKPLEPLEPLEPLNRVASPANLIILNTPPSPSSKKIPQMPSELNCDLLTIPQRKTPISDPVSPNPPWHVELDRRHSDSAGHSFLENTEPIEEPQQHTYQNTNLINVGAKPKVASHDQLLQKKNSRQ